MRYGFDRVLHLPLPELSERGRVWTTTELYYERAAPSKVELECRECGVRTPHREQARSLTQPNVLLLQVQRRRGPQGRFSRHAVQPETVLTLPGHDRYELAAVVYHQGPHAESGRYYCVVRAQDLSLIHI